MFEAYKKHRELKRQQQQERAMEFRIKQAREKRLDRSMHQRQATCEHEFSGIQAYAYLFDQTRHFVVCKKCALRREV